MELELVAAVTGVAGYTVVIIIHRTPFPMGFGLHWFAGLVRATMA